MSGSERKIYFWIFCSRSRKWEGRADIRVVSGRDITGQQTTNCTRIKRNKNTTNFSRNRIKNKKSTNCSCTRIKRKTNQTNLSFRSHILTHITLYYELSNEILRERKCEIYKIWHFHFFSHQNSWFFDMIKECNSPLEFFSCSIHSKASILFQNQKVTEWSVPATSSQDLKSREEWKRS